MIAVDARDRLARRTVSADASVLSAVERLRRDLDAVEKAIRENNRVPGSVSGDSFVASTARDLEREIRDRQYAYDTLSLVRALAEEESQ